MNHTLKEAILVTISRSPDRARVNSLIETCRALAASFLRSKATAGNLAALHGVSINDLAYDCIADLFRQDEKGNYLELQSYFGGLRLEDLRNEEILPHLRRLVFSKVNQGVYRLYQETDPSLSKILRNVKLAVSALKNFTEIERFGEACITPSLTDTLEHLPPFDRGELEDLFTRTTTGRERIPQLLAKLSLLLREQTEYCRIVPLVSVGILFRKVYEQKKGIDAEANTIENAMALTDAHTIIRDSCDDVREKIRPKYVDTGKVCEEIFCCYFKAIEEELLNRVLGRDGDAKHLFAALKKYLPDLGREGYMEEHRSRLEYMLKLVGERVSLKLQREV